MVENQKADRALPEAGDHVGVMIGSQRLPGRVLEAYASGAQPRVLIELDQAAGSEERITITVPPRSIEPTESTHSPWAEAQRFESNFASAVKLLAKDVTIERESPFGMARADFILSNGSRRVVVEMKYLKKSAGKNFWKSAFRQLHQASHETGALPLLVTNVDVPAAVRVPPDIRVVRWSDERDDRRLRQELAEMLQ